MPDETRGEGTPSERSQRERPDRRGGKRVDREPGRKLRARRAGDRDHAISEGGKDSPRAEDRRQTRGSGEERRSGRDRRVHRSAYPPAVERRRHPERRVARSGAGEFVENLLENPVRGGLVGLAMAGTAAPIALSHYQNELRTDESHEKTVSEPPADASPEGVSAEWKELEGEDRAATSDRESVILSSLGKYAEFDLTRELAEQIYDAASLNRIDPEVAFGLVRAESSFRNTSTSEVGAIGLTQLMPKTAEFLEPGISRAELREPGTNLRIGFSYLRSLIDKYGDEDLALLAYNRGPGTVDKALKRGENPDNGYAAFVRGEEGHGHTLYTR